MDTATPVEANSNSPETPVVQENTEQGSEQAVEAPVAQEPENPYADELRKKNSENRALRDREKAARVSLDEKEALLSQASEKLTQAESRILELENQLHEQLIERKVLELASTPQIGARRPEAVLKLINRDAVTFKNNEVRGLTEEVQRVKKEFPELFLNAGLDGGAGNGSTPDIFDMNAFLRGKAGV